MINIKLKNVLNQEDCTNKSLALKVGEYIKEYKQEEVRLDVEGCYISSQFIDALFEYLYENNLIYLLYKLQFKSVPMPLKSALDSSRYYWLTKEIK